MTPYQRKAIEILNRIKSEEHILSNDLRRNGTVARDGLGEGAGRDTDG